MTGNKQAFDPMLGGHGTRESAHKWVDYWAAVWEGKKNPKELAQMLRSPLTSRR